MQKVIFITLLAVSLCACHVARFTTRNFANITDHKFFENEHIQKSKKPFYFYTSDNATKQIPKHITTGNQKVAFDQYIEKNYTTAFLIIKRDTLLYEKYFNGSNQKTVSSSFSMAKSYVSALIGILVEEGKIKDLNEPITNYLSIFKKPGFEKITIQHLLDMQSGIKFNESYINPFGHAAKFYYGRNLKKYVSKLKIEEPPGKFRYKSVDTQILGLLIEKVTQKSLAKNLEEKIWTKIGTTHHASWSLDSKKHKTAKGFSSINATAQDFAKFGRLYLNKGAWSNEQVVPANWVKQSLTYLTNKNNFAYQNQWWTTTLFEEFKDSTNLKQPYQITEYTTNNSTKKYIKKPSGTFMAQGILGQYIYVNPEKEIIIVRLGKKYGNANWKGIFDAIAKSLD